MHRPLPPLFALALGILALAMLMPASAAAILGEWRAGRSFLYAGIATGFAAAIVGVALSGARRFPGGQGELVALVGCWVLLPVFAALPVHLITPQIGFAGAWFEMVAAFTTTGGTIYAAPDTLPLPLHLWRGLVGWLGGLLTLSAAYAILAPRRLGGFEVLLQSDAEGARDGGTAGRGALGLSAGFASIETRLRRALRAILPVYAGLTLALALVLHMLGQGPIVAGVHAMAVLSTSGISAHAAGLASQSNILAELAIAVFLVLAATRLIYARASQIGARTGPFRDPELRLMAALVAVVSAALFLRHWVAVLSLEAAQRQGLGDALEAFWGGVFTALSFLTTTGFESAFWDSARSWSGLPSPGLVLLGLCAIGGGAATTAGGVKLIRVASLLRQGVQELDHLAQPNAVLGSGSGLHGRSTGQGAFIAWAFVMLYVFAVFAVTLALGLLGMPFERALIAALAAITNTGPVYAAVLGPEASFGLIDPAGRAILSIGMILGRIEALVIIALFSPDLWRRFAQREKTAGKALPGPSQSRW
ncbi:MAG: potassium transporter TrkG [Thermohalobaculum sp.]|nr:potassium transporter TrkG [Thermohalobaculum sp.]